MNIDEVYELINDLLILLKESCKGIDLTGKNNYVIIYICCRVLDDLNQLLR